MPRSRRDFTRREMLTIAGSAAAALGLAGLARRSPAAPLPAVPSTAPATTTPALVRARPNARYKIAADDLFLLQRQKVKAFPLAAKCGLDGVAVDMGGMSGGKTIANELVKPEVRQQFLDAAKTAGVEICALAFFGMYAHVFCDMPIADEIMTQWIDCMSAMNVRIGHMPLMTKDGTLRDHPEVWKKTVAIYKKYAPAAEKAGVVLGVESDLDAAGYKRFLDDVGSPAVKVVYNPGVGLENKFDVYKDIKDLGKDRICLLHMEQGSVPPEKFEHLLGEGPIDCPKLKGVLDEIGWSGWLAIARSRKQGRERKVEENMTANAKYLHSVFNE